MANFGKCFSCIINFWTDTPSYLSRLIRQNYLNSRFDLYRANCSSARTRNNNSERRSRSSSVNKKNDLWNESAENPARSSLMYSYIMNLKQRPRSATQRLVSEVKLNGNQLYEILLTKKIKKKTRNCLSHQF